MAGGMDRFCPGNFCRGITDCIAAGRVYWGFGGEWKDSCRLRIESAGPMVMRRPCGKLAKWFRAVGGDGWMTGWGSIWRRCRR